MPPLDPPPFLVGTSESAGRSLLDDSGQPYPVQPVAAAAFVSGLGPFINVGAAPYNADPTGATDATAAFQAALDLAYKTGQLVYVPEPSASYLINGNLVPSSTAHYAASAVLPLVATSPQVLYSGARAARPANQTLVLNQAPGQGAYNPAWFALTTIAINPGAGSDAASGAPGDPLNSWAEVIRRYGSKEPTMPIGQVTTYTFQASSGIGDPIFFEPRVSYGGQCILVATPVLVATQAITVSTSKARGAPGTLLVLTLASCPAGIAAGWLVVNNSSATPSQALVDSVGATVVMQQPQTTASLDNLNGVPAPVEDDTWASTNSCSFYTLLSLNVKRWQPVGGDASSAGHPCGGWIFSASITDSSGTGASTFPFGNTSLVNVLVNCVVAPKLLISNQGGSINKPLFLGCTMLANTTTTSGAPVFYGGALNGATLGLGAFLTNDVIVHGTVNQDAGGVSIGNVYSDGTFAIFSAATVSGTFWGSYACTVNPGAFFYNATGSTFVLKALLTSGALKLGTATTGTSYTPGTGLWASAINITPANLDANAGLQDPITGARFTDVN